MNVYEKIVILNPSLSDEELNSAIEKISNFITNAGGEILKVDNWGKKKLAYEVNKQKTGFYVLFLFKSPSSVIKKIEDYFKVFDPVVKFMVIKLSKKQIAALPKDVMVLEAKQEAAAAVQEVAPDV